MEIKVNAGKRTSHYQDLLMYTFIMNSSSTGCLKKNFLLSKLAMANITVDNEKSSIIFHD